MLWQEKKFSFDVFVTIKPSSAEQWYPSIIRNCVSVDDGSYVCKHFVLSTLRNCRKYTCANSTLQASELTQSLTSNPKQHTGKHPRTLIVYRHTSTQIMQRLNYVLPQGTKCLTYANWSIGSRQTVQIGQTSWRLYRYYNYIIIIANT